MSTYVFTKNGSLERPRNVSESTFNSDPYGTTYTYTPFDNPITKYFFSGSTSYNSNDYLKLKALKNTINYYSAVDNIYNFNNFYNTPTSLICLNSYHLGSGIERGSVELKFYQSGSLIDTARDKRENGVLYNDNNEKVGVVLYKEGFFLFNNTGSINTTDSVFATIVDKPRWIYFMGQVGDNIYFQNNFRVLSQLPAETIMCYADKGQLNHSNNPSYIKYVSGPVPLFYNLNFSRNHNAFYISLF